MRTSELFDLSHTRADKLLSRHEYPWKALGEIGEFVKELGKSLDAEIFSEVSENVWIAKNAKIYPSACIEAPCIIGENTEVRHCAFIRGKVIIGDGCVIGAGSVVTRDIPPRSFAAGVPARVVREITDADSMKYKPGIIGDNSVIEG